MLKDTPVAIHLRDYRPPDFLIDTVELDFDLGPDSTTVRSRLAIRRNPAGRPGAPLVLNGEELELLSLAIDGVALGAERYRLDDSGLQLGEVPDRFTLEVATRIHPARNTALEGLYVSNDMFCTQCEAEGFRRITYYLDRSDVMARFRTRIVADAEAYPVMLSNGNLVEQGVLDDGRHWVVWDDPFPKPSYLFALVAGRLDVREDEYTTGSGRRVALRVYVRPGDLDKTAHAMESLKKAMAWDEATFGLEYDLDIYMIVAVSDFNMGAMENKGLNVFNTAFVLARPDTATDGDYANIEGVIGHEYFHNWSGNRVTCRDWFQLSLKEGLTVFRDQEFSADMGSRAVKRIDDVRMLRARQFPEDAGPMAHPVRPESYVEVNNFYTATVYEKGAELVRMIQTLVGREGFRRGMDLYFERHDGQAVTTDDFVQAMADSNDVDLEQFRRWYRQAGTPVLTARGIYNADGQTYRLELAQRTAPTPGQPDKEPLHIPVCLGLLDSDGSDLPLVLADGMEVAPGQPLHLREEAASFTFVNIARPPTLSLLRGFSAPVRVETDLDDEALAFLFAHDTDAFNRWDAGQELATRVMQRMVKEVQAGQTPAVDRLYIDALETMLARTDLDPALVAEALVPPGEGVLTELSACADPDAIHEARTGLRRTVAQALRDRLIEVYEMNRDGGPYRLAPDAMARRRLKNCVLGILAENGDPDTIDLIARQYRIADNMTDRIGALVPLMEIDCPERAEGLEDFFERGRDDALVLDKWFAIQAGCSRPDTLARVRELLSHPSFEIRNPNKVRALIGTFAHRNLVRFHGAGGAGYRFVADQVLQLDSLNPQVAARLAGAFNRWRKYDNTRQGLMREELQRILDTDGLSRAVYEIVSLALQD
jgi:aminopeptidase N